MFVLICRLFWQQVFDKVLYLTPFTHARRSSGCIFMMDQLGHHRCTDSADAVPELSGAPFFPDEDHWVHDVAEVPADAGVTGGIGSPSPHDASTGEPSNICALYTVMHRASCSARATGSMVMLYFHLGPASLVAFVVQDLTMPAQVRHKIADSDGQVQLGDQKIEFPLLLIGPP